MIKIENVQVDGFEAAIRGMRNPKNSWDRIDSDWCGLTLSQFAVGPNDKALMKKLNKGGSVHAKYRRFINVTFDVTAPLYWYKEMDTYKIGTVCNSCSTMHTAHKRDFTIDDFSTDGMLDITLSTLQATILTLNWCRQKFVETGDKEFWRSMIMTIPTTLNQRRTYQFSYEALVGLYRDRKDHRLTEWHTFCDWIKDLPEAWIITGEE